MNGHHPGNGAQNPAYKPSALCLQDSLAVSGTALRSCLAFVGRVRNKTLAIRLARTVECKPMSALFPDRILLTPLVRRLIPGFREFRLGVFRAGPERRDAMAKPTTIKIRLNSTADTGHFYVTKKNARTMTEKMTVRKYDPVARRHVEYREGKIK